MAQWVSDTHVVEEPDQADTQQSEPVVAQNQPVRCLMSHGVLGKLFRLLESKTHDEEDERKYNTDSQASSPNRAEVAVVAGRRNHV